MRYLRSTYHGEIGREATACARERPETWITYHGEIGREATAINRSFRAHKGRGKSDALCALAAKMIPLPPARTRLTSTTFPYSYSFYSFRHSPSPPIRLPCVSDVVTFPLTSVPSSVTSRESRSPKGRQPATLADGAGAVPAGGGSSPPLPGGFGKTPGRHDDRSAT